MVLVELEELAVTGDDIGCLGCECTFKDTIVWLIFKNMEPWWSWIGELVVKAVQSICNLGRIPPKLLTDKGSCNFLKNERGEMHVDLSLLCQHQNPLRVSTYRQR